MNAYLLTYSLALILSASLQAQQYDLIFVGAGTAGSIVCAKLAEHHQDKTIALIDAGGPLSRTVGGDVSPPYFVGIQNAPTYNDIPREWRFIFQKKWREKYNVPQSSIFFQGKGYGGLSEFNAMICQIPPPSDFAAWPEGWNWEDVSPYFSDLLASVNITTTPSANGKRYGQAFDAVIRSLAKNNSIPEGNTLALSKNGQTFFGPLSIYATDGERKSSSGTFLKDVVDSKGKSKRKNLHLLPYCTVEKIILEGNKATKVAYRDAEGKVHEAQLNDTGKVIMAAGSLNTPRLLLLSGIGPSGKEKRIFGSDTEHSFPINNPLVGFYIHDHFYFRTAHLIYNKELKWEMSDQEAIDLYVKERSGPYAQSGPIMFLFGSSDGKQRDFEIIISHLGRKQQSPDQPIDMFQPFIVPFYSTERNSLKIDNQGNLENMEISVPGGDKDVTTLALSYQKFLNWINNDPNVSVQPDIEPDIEQLKKLIRESKYTSHGKHFGGGCPLSDKEGTNPKTLLVEGTENIHVVDGSLIPSPLGAHPVLTIMALALKAAETIDQQLSHSRDKN